MRPGFRLNEIALIHGVPPWIIDATRAVPGMRGRLTWRLRATAYRVGLRRLAALRLDSD
jgi:hypothetical protein